MNDQMTIYTGNVVQSELELGEARRWTRATGLARMIGLASEDHGTGGYLTLSDPADCGEGCGSQ